MKKKSKKLKKNVKNSCRYFTVVLYYFCLLVIILLEATKWNWVNKYIIALLDLLMR